MEANSKKIAIIGHFGGSENLLDGQTIKTKILYDELKKATDWEIKTVDTYLKKSHPIKLLFKSIACCLSTKDIIVLLSGNGMKFYFPLLSFFVRVRRIRVFHDVIGGNLHEYVKKYPAFEKYLNTFYVNWVETQNLKDNLEKVGVMNCEVLPNFKRLDIVKKNEVKTDFEIPFKFCIFSRVMKEKGVEDAISAIQRINTKSGQVVCKLDIYGKIEESYKDRFEALLKDVNTFVRYRGQVPYEKSTEFLKKYYALLFPTYWDGEGFPGTIIDAFSAGLPVIATDWNSNSEIVEHSKTGFIYNRQTEDLATVIEWAIGNLTEMVTMRENCQCAAFNYQPDRYIGKIINKLEE